MGSLEGMLALKIKLLGQIQDPEFNRTLETHFYRPSTKIPPIQINDLLIQLFQILKIPILTHGRNIRNLRDNTVPNPTVLFTFSLGFVLQVFPSSPAPTEALSWAALVGH